MSQSRRPAVDVSSTLSQYQQPKEAGSRKTGAKGSPGNTKTERVGETSSQCPRPRAGLEAETEGEPQGGDAASRQKGRPTPADAGEAAALYHFSVLGNSLTKEADGKRNLPATDRGSLVPARR